MINFNNKWINGALPALFIHSCIGSVYCWSLLKGDIASAMNVDVSNIEFAFTLAIFFLGMSAAFGGRLVEKNVRKASFISMIAFTSGLLLSCVSIQLGNPSMLFLTYGMIMGIGLGIGYLSPVKTLMLWFKDNKGLATGIAISGFGLSKMLFSPYIEWCNSTFGIMTTLVTMSIFSAILMSVAAYFIKKPEEWIEVKDKFSFKKAFSIITNYTYIKIWTIFFINITCGLVLISFEKNIALDSGIEVGSIALVASMTAMFNTLGRLGYSTLSDYVVKKERIYNIIFISSAVCCFFFPLTGGNLIALIVLLMVVNLGYGGGFSTMPILIGSKFGMQNLSVLHGFVLTAWSWGSVAAFIITQVLIYEAGVSYETLVIFLCLLYVIALIISLRISKTEIKQLAA